MEIAIIAAIYIYTAVFDFVPVIEKKVKRTIWVYSVLYTLSVTIIVLYLINPHTKSIAGYIIDVYDYIAKK